MAWSLCACVLCRVRVAGSPRGALPCGLRAVPPVGCLRAAPAFAENALLGAAFALETAIGFDATGGRTS